MQHGAENMCAASLECQLVNLEGDFEATPERQRRSRRTGPDRGRQPPDDGLRAHEPDALDLPPRTAVVRWRVQREQLAQRCRALLGARVHEREVVEGQMADGAPG